MTKSVSVKEVRPLFLDRAKINLFILNYYN